MAETNQVANGRAVARPGTSVAPGRSTPPTAAPVAAPAATTTPATAAATAAPVAVAVPRRRLRGETENNPYLNMLLYSDYGVGKTHLASTAEDVPGMNDIILANVDYGDEVLRESSKIDILDFNTYDEFNQLYQFAQLHCGYRDSQDIVRMRKLESEYMRVPLSSIDRPREYRTFIFDNLTEMQKLCMYKQLGVDVKLTKVGESFPKASFDEWNQVLEQLLLQVRKYRNLPLNTIFLCQVEETEDNTRKRFHLPLLQGQAQRLIHGFFDCVGYYAMAVEGSGAQAQIQRRLYLSPIGPFKAKNRFRDFSQHWLDNPTMADIIKAKQGQYRPAK